MAFTNSSLICTTILSPNYSKRKSDKIDTIMIHHMAGNLSVETCGNLFKKKQASSNYGIGTDGRIALYVEEKNRAWTSGGTDKDGNVIYNHGYSGAMMDHRAVTIEVANDSLAPDWHVSDKALESLIELCTDICRRNNIESLKWLDDEQYIGQCDKQTSVFTSGLHVLLAVVLIYILR